MDIQGGPVILNKYDSVVDPDDNMYFVGYWTPVFINEWLTINESFPIIYDHSLFSYLRPNWGNANNGNTPIPYLPNFPDDSMFFGVNFKFTTPPTSPTPVDIDIKPGSYPNSINLGSHGVVPVAILSSETFDATNVDPDTVALEGAGVAVRGKGNKFLAHEEDVDGDGRLDLVCQVETENFDPDAFQDGYGWLTGTTYDGEDIEGFDEITIVPPQ